MRKGQWLGDRMFLVFLGLLVNSVARPRPWAQWAAPTAHSVWPFLCPCSSPVTVQFCAHPRRLSLSLTLLNWQLGILDTPLLS